MFLRFLQSPTRVFLFCLAAAVFSLILKGGLLHLYQLQRDQQNLTQQLTDLRRDVAKLDNQLKMAKDPSFIERQALDLYDLAQEHDLVFVFPEENTN